VDWLEEDTGLPAAATDLPSLDCTAADCLGTPLDCTRDRLDGGIRISCSNLVDPVCSLSGATGISGGFAQWALDYTS